MNQMKNKKKISLNSHCVGEGTQDRFEEIIFKRRRTINLDRIDDDWSEKRNSDKGNCCLVDNKMEEQITARRISLRAYLDRMKYQLQHKYVEDMEEMENKKRISMNNHREVIIITKRRTINLADWIGGDWSEHKNSDNSNCCLADNNMEGQVLSRRISSVVTIQAFFRGCLHRLKYQRQLPRKYDENMEKMEHKKRISLNNHQFDSIGLHSHTTQRLQLQNSLSRSREATRSRSALSCSKNNNSGGNNKSLASLLSSTNDNAMKLPQLKQSLSTSSIRVEQPPRKQVARSRSAISFSNIKSKNNNNNNKLASILNTTNSSRGEFSFNDDNATRHTYSFQYLQERKNRLLQLQKTAIDIERKKCLELQQIEKTKQLQLQKLTDEYNEYNNNKIREWQQKQQEKNGAFFAPLDENPRELIDSMKTAYELIRNLKKANEQLKQQKEKMEKLLAEIEM